MTDLTPAFDLCRQAIEDGLVPGAALSCGRRGQEPVRRIFGAAALEPRRRDLLPTTRFDLASLTKVLATTWLLMRRWEEGLDLDAPLGGLLPDYYPPDKEQLTLRLLLAHAAGLPSGLRLRDEMTAAQAGTETTRRRVIERFLATPVGAAPGTETRYSDIGPILLGDLLEHLDGDRLDRLCQRELYEPTSLGATGFLPLAPSPPPAGAHAFAATERCTWRGRVMAGQVHDENAYLMNGIAGHAGLFAPIGDLELIAARLLDPDAQGPLTAAAVDTFTRRQDLVEGSSRALGWDTARPGCPGGNRLSETAFGHTGFTGTSMWIDPRQGLYVILLTNRIHPRRDNDAFLAFRPQLHDAVVEALTS